MTKEMENVMDNYFLRNNYEYSVKDLLKRAFSKSDIKINDVTLYEKYKEASENDLAILVNYSGNEKNEEELKNFLSTYQPIEGKNIIWNSIDRNKYGTNSQYLSREDEIVKSLCPDINLDTKLVNDVKKDYGFLQKKGYQEKEQKKKKKRTYDAQFANDFSMNGVDNDGSFLVEDEHGFYSAPKKDDHSVSSIRLKNRDYSLSSSLSNEKQNVENKKLDNLSQVSLSENLSSSNSDSHSSFTTLTNDEEEKEMNDETIPSEENEKNEKEEENNEKDIKDTGQEEEDILDRNNNYFEEDWSDPFENEEEVINEEENEVNMKDKKEMNEEKEMKEPTLNVISDDVKLVADEATRRYMERFGKDKDKHQALREKTRYDMENVIDSIQKNQFPIMEAKDNVDYIVNPKDYSIYKGYNQLGLQINNALNNLDTTSYVPLKDFYNNKGIMNQKLKTCSQIITKGRDEEGNYIFEIVVPCKVRHKDKKKEKQRAKEEKRRNIFDAKFNYKYGELPLYYTELNINDKFQRPQLDKKYVNEIKKRQCDSDIEQRFNNDMANYFACMFTKEKYVPQTDWTKSKWKDELLNFAVNNPDKVVNIANSSYRDIKNKFVEVNNEMNKEKAMENSHSIYTGR